jgi:hypothetical protein
LLAAANHRAVRGSTDVWRELFANDAAARNKAIEILRQVTRDFDIEHGTSIAPSLEKELKITGRVPGASPPQR